MRFLVIGYGTAGQTAASTIRKLSREAEVIVLERHRYPIYHPCSLPMVLSGRLDLDDVVERRPWPGVEVRTESNVISVNLDRKKVTYERRGDLESLDFDKLIISTGLKPTFPQVEGLDLEGVGTVWDVESVEHLLGIMGDKIVVVGGSATGIEVSAELAHTGKDVTLLEMEDQLMPGKIDPPIASLAAKTLSSLEVKVRVKTPLRSIIGRSGRVSEVIGGNARYEADTVIVVTGARPNSTLAEKAGLKVGVTGGVVVDEYFYTSSKQVLAAGDVAEVKDFITGRPTTTGLASTAMVQGKIAGQNCIGRFTRYEGAVSPFIVSVGKYLLGGVGLTASLAERLGITHATFRIAASDLPRYMEGRDRLVLWLVTDSMGRILGGQVFGKRGVRDRVAMLTLAIVNRMRLQDLRKIPLPYNPEVCDVADPLAMLSDAIFLRRSVT